MDMCLLMSTYQHTASLTVAQSLFGNQKVCVLKLFFQDSLDHSGSFAFPYESQYPFVNFCRKERESEDFDRGCSESVGHFRGFVILTVLNLLAHEYRMSSIYLFFPTFFHRCFVVFRVQVCMSFHFTWTTVANRTTFLIAFADYLWHP